MKHQASRFRAGEMYWPATAFSTRPPRPFFSLLTMAFVATVFLDGFPIGKSCLRIAARHVLRSLEQSHLGDNEVGHHIPSFLAICNSQGTRQPVG